MIFSKLHITLFVYWQQIARIWQQNQPYLDLKGIHYSDYF